MSYQIKVIRPLTPPVENAFMSEKTTILTPLLMVCVPPYRMPWLGLIGMALVISLLPGCNIVGYVAHGVSGDGKKTHEVTADYPGLAGKSVAVIVAADEMTLFAHPGVQTRVCRAVTTQMAADIPGLELSDPEQIARFQLDNPYWNTLTYSELLAKLKVERLVYIDLTEYATHEPGNRHVWQGSVIAGVSVAASDASDPNNLVYTSTVTANFPEDGRIGVLDSNDNVIQAGMLRNFSLKVSRLFHNHKVTK